MWLYTQKQFSRIKSEYDRQTDIDAVNHYFYLLRDHKLIADTLAKNPFENF